MRVEEAKLMSDNANQLKETLKLELYKVYEEIKESALLGIYVVCIRESYLRGENIRSKYLEKYVVESLENNGYSVERCYDNPFKPYLIVSWK